MIVLLSFGAKNSFAGTPDPLTGVRISLLGVQTSLASPPLPDLHETHKGSLKTQASFITANVDDSEDIGQGLSLTSNGTFRGGSIGLGYTTPSNKAWGYFAFATANSVSGNLKLDQMGMVINLADMTNRGLAVSGGVSLKLLQARNSPIALGIFMGPTASIFSSDFNVKDSTGTNIGGHYSATPFTYGAMAGAQASFSMFGLYLNPYYVYYRDLTDGCKSFNSDHPVSGTSGCSEGGNYIPLPLTFGAYGLNIGFRKFFFTIYSHVNKDSSMNSIDLHDYQLSYTFAF